MSGRLQSGWFTTLLARRPLRIVIAMLWRPTYATQMEALMSNIRASLWTLIGVSHLEPPLRNSVDAGGPFAATAGGT
jgi:hypothetical protein